MKRRLDLWLALTRMASFLVNDLRAEQSPVCPPEIAESTLSAFADVPGVERERKRLEHFVRQLCG